MTRRLRSHSRRTTPPTPLFRERRRLIAGIPSDKSLVGNGIDGFKVAQFSNSTNLLQNAFGAAISGVTGNLAFNPSAAHPELEFSISNLTKSGINPTQGFWIEMYAGSGQDVVAGEAGLVWTYVPPFEPQQIPEPTTWLVWAGSGRWPRMAPAFARGEPALDDFLLAMSINASLRNKADVPSYRRLLTSASYDEQYGRFGNERRLLPSRPYFPD